MRVEIQKPALASFMSDTMIHTSDHAHEFRITRDSMRDKIAFPKRALYVQCEVFVVGGWVIILVHLSNGPGRDQHLVACSCFCPALS